VTGRDPFDPRHRRRKHRRHRSRRHGTASGPGAPSHGDGQA
jgi:hypothetical protein